MSPTEPLEPSSTQISNNWYLLTVRSKKRELFLKYLKLAIEQNKLEELVLDIKIPQESVYQDIVLLKISNFKSASTYLQKVESFLNIERKPLQIEQVNRMLSIK